MGGERDAVVVEVVSEKEVPQLLPTGSNSGGSGSNSTWSDSDNNICCRVSR